MVSSTQSQPKDTKLEILCDRLRALALEKGPHAQLPTVRTLCHLLGTTRVTLTEALNVLEEQHIVYRMDRKGIFVSPKIYHKFIHILFDASTVNGENASPFWSMLWIHFAQEVQRRAKTREETCTFELVIPTQNYTNTVPEDVMQQLRSGRYDALLAVGFNIFSEEWQHNPPVPGVVFAGAGAYQVGLNQKELIQQGTQVLIEQGCQRIALWLAMTDEMLEDIDRSPAALCFRQTLQKGNVPFYPDFVRQLPFYTQNGRNYASLKNQEYGYQLALKVFGGDHAKKPDGIVIGDDMIADGALVAFEELGIRVGRDVKIATHANKASPILFGRTKNLTVMEYDPAILVRTMFEMLDALLAGNKPPIPHVLLSPEVRKP